MREDWVGYLDDLDPEKFDWRDYLNGLTYGLDRGLILRTSRGRRALTKNDPLAFALVYFPHHLRSNDTGDQITMARFHLDLFSEARRWRHHHGHMECRSAWVAPRDSGKSTLSFLLLPMWALAHGWRNFVIALADSGGQAQIHLMSFKRELDTNELLREDYPDLCAPAVRPSGVTVADRQAEYIARSGATFVAKGADASSLGIKVENRRPDLILFDDIEPHEAIYSLYQKEGRLDTVTSAVFPMSLNAAVLFTGTTTMSGSIMHDLVRQITDKEAPTWPRDEKIDVHYYPPIVTRPDGTRASLWPARWSLEFLLSIEGSRSYAKNFLNQPSTPEGGYWSQEDITYGTVPAVTRRVLFIDAVVKEKKTTPDRTGIVIMGYSPTDGRCIVEHAEGVMLTGGKLRDHLAKVIARHPGRIHGIVIETNQGGDLWLEVLGPLGLKVIPRTSSDSKPERLAKALDQYQKPRPLVVHARRFPALEEEMTVYPRHPTDDVVDACAQGALFFLKPRVVQRSRSTVASYR